MSKPVHDYRKDGLRFRLYPDGNITVSSKDLPERSLHQLDCITGLTSKWFSKLCRAMIQDGFLDGMLAEQARISKERGMKRNAGVELYEALEDMLSGWKYIRETHGDLYGVGWDRAQNKALAALAKARGEA